MQDYKYEGQYTNNSHPLSRVKREGRDTDRQWVRIVITAKLAFWDAERKRSLLSTHFRYTSTTLFFLHSLTVSPTHSLTHALTHRDTRQKTTSRQTTHGHAVTLVNTISQTTGIHEHSWSFSFSSHADIISSEGSGLLHSFSPFRSHIYMYIVDVHVA